jgi:5-methylcytosine-specific restriction endonuclease McrA
MIMTLKCVKCGFEGKEEFFMKDNGKRCGYRSICKRCRNDYLDCWRDKNRERIEESNRRYYENNPGKRKEISSKYYKRISFNNEKMENRRRISRKWSRTFKGRVMRKIQEQKRRKYIKDTDDGTINFYSIMELMKRQNYKCAISGKDISRNFHIDHIIPLFKDGKHIISNIQLLHPIENLRKGTK